MKSIVSAVMIASLSTLVFVQAREAQAQAWTREQGAAYLQLSLSRMRGDKLYGADFDRTSIASPYAQTLISFYGEVGIIDRWLTAVVDAELFRRNSLEGQGATQGLGDLRIGAMTGLVQEGPWRVSAGLFFGLPTGDDAPSPEQGADGDATLIARSLPTGDGEFDLRPVVAVGRSFGGGAWPLEHYVSASAGYWLRTRGFADAFTYNAEVGTRVNVFFLDRFWWIVRAQGVESFASAGQAGFAGLGDGVTYTSLGATVFGHIYGGVSASVGVDTAFRARNIIAAIPFRFGIAYEL